MEPCSSCRSIPFLGISKAHAKFKFKYRTYPVGEQLEEFYLYEEEIEENGDPVGFPYHLSTEALRDSAEECPLCKIVWKDVERSVESYTQNYDASLQNAKSHARKFGNPYPYHQPLELFSRPDKRSGFVVVVRNVYERCSMIVVARLSMFVPSASPIAKSIRGRRVGSTTLCSSGTTWLRRCIKRCEQFHENCRILKDTSFTPKRLLCLDAIDGDPDSIRLVEPDDVVSIYAALSYCWGPDSFFKATHENVARLREGINPEVLPQIFRDAIWVAKHLQISYLWIDALCIVQDSEQDWAEQVAQMGSIYRNAIVTLAAPYSTRADQGCDYDAPSCFLDQVVLPVQGTPHSVTLFANGPLSFGQRNVRVRDSVLMERGWAFQERVLASRTAFFSKTEMVFDCHHSLRTQSGYEGRPLLEVAKQRCLGTEKPGKHAYLDDWYGSVYSYTGKYLSKVADRLPGMAGIAACFQQRIGSDYLAGMWSSLLPESLLFEACQGNSWDSGVYETYIAPSWSWAAHSMPSWNMKSLGRKPYAEVIDYGVTPRVGGSPFGEVADGWLKMRAPLLRLRQCGPPEPEPRDQPTHVHMSMELLFDTDRSLMIFNGNIDLRIHQRTNPEARHESVDLYVLIVAQMRWRFPGWADHISGPFGLLVTPAGPERTEMQRVGMIGFTDEKGSYDNKDNLIDWDVLQDRDNFSTVVLV